MAFILTRTTHTEVRAWSVEYMYTHTPGRGDIRAWNERAHDAPYARTPAFKRIAEPQNVDISEVLPERRSRPNRGVADADADEKNRKKGRS